MSMAFVILVIFLVAVALWLVVARIREQRRIKVAAAKLESSHYRFAGLLDDLETLVVGDDSKGLAVAQPDAKPETVTVVSHDVDIIVVIATPYWIERRFRYVRTSHHLRPIPNHICPAEHHRVAWPDPWQPEDSTDYELAAAD